MSKDLDSVISRIRFGLDQLRVRNGHHEFEHLCRHLARARICSNLLPATGPVSAGGDQGRDFETFQTFLTKELADSTGFLGLVSEDPLVFACTLQVDKIESKISQDLRSIVSHRKPKGVHFFCVADVPVAKRHKLQKAANEDHGITLNIYDGQAVAELLADHDVFWIAMRYLHLTAETLPSLPADAADERYTESLANWKDGESLPSSFSDISEIRAGARYATSVKKATADLHVWTALLEQARAESAFDEVKRIATYELIVANLMGVGTLLGRESLVREYLADPATEATPSSLMDATVILNYCVGAIGAEKLEIDIAEIDGWRQRIIGAASEKLSSAESQTVRCALLEVRGYTNAFGAIAGNGEMDDTFEDWEELLRLALDAPLYPIVEFAEHLNAYGEFIGEHPRYDELILRADDLVRIRVGDFRVAERCRDRAIRHFEAGRIRRAIGEFHKARVGWFAKETFRGSLLSLLFLAQCYRELGLDLAAKYHALAVSSSGGSSQDVTMREFLARGLTAVAQCDSRLGASLGFLYFSRLGLQCHNTFLRNDDPAGPQSPVGPFLLHATILRALTTRVNGSLGDDIDELTALLGLSDLMGQGLPVAQKVWELKSDSEVLNQFSTRGIPVPFADLSTTRLVHFCALGIEWELTWLNDLETTAVGECFGATLQILLVEVANYDLCTLPTAVSVEVLLHDGKQIHPEDVPSNEGRQWRVHVPRSGSIRNDLEAWNKGVVACAFTILAEVSLVDESKVKDVLDDLFRRGLADKTLVWNNYDALFREFVDEESWEDGASARRLDAPPFGAAFPMPHSELALPERLGPCFQEKNELERIEKRYVNAMLPVRLTIERLSNDSRFLESARLLREEGLKDWHILSAIAAAVVNIRVQRKLGSETDPAKHTKAFQDLFFEEETEELEPISSDLLSIDVLRRCHEMNSLTILKTLGHTVRQRTPDFSAIQEFLRVRYKYLELDVEHKSMF